MQLYSNEGRTVGTLVNFVKNYANSKFSRLISANAKSRFLDWENGDI